MRKLKQCLVVCFAFAFVTLTIFAIYVHNIGVTQEAIRSKKKHQHQILHENKDAEPADTPHVQADTPHVQSNQSKSSHEARNVSLSAQSGNQSPGKRDKPGGNVAGKTLNETRTAEKPVPRDGQLLKNQTPDPLYTHHGYIGVLDSKKKLNLHCMQCAYVSSSGQLLQSRIGYLIDEADCIFRMNDAPVPSYEEDVGSRTTVRVVGHASTYNLKNKRQYLLQESTSRYVVGWGPAKHLQTNGKGYAYNNLKEMATKYKNVNFFYLTQQQMKHADEIFEEETGSPRQGSGTFLSTGWFTMLLARQVCDEIHVYGMINDEYCQSSPSNNVPYHYYNPRGSKECDYYRVQEKGKRGFHRFMTEKAVFARWAHEQPLIYFHVPDWNPR